MLDEMKAIQDGLPITTAARVHGVPRTSLHNRIKGRVIHRVKPGPKQYLSAEEEAELAIEAASVGCGQTRKQIMTIAENVAKDKGILRKDRISEGWYEKFMERQTNLSICQGDPAANEMAVTSQAITHYFDLLEKKLKDNNLLNKPAQIYNVGETGMAHEHCGSWNKAQTTVVACVNAIGQELSSLSIHGDVVDDNPSCDISDVEACSDEYLENEELFNRRYEEGYNIYSEPYAKWLLKNHPRETPTD